MPDAGGAYYSAAFSVEGDCRFMSHHDTMRLVELVVFRAEIPVAFSGGFNPRPKISLPLPRPVGMASLDELLVMKLTDGAEIDGIPERLNSQCPEGVRFLNCRPMARRGVETLSAEHRLELDADEAEAVTAALGRLSRQERWLVLRGSGASKATELDIRPLVGQLELEAGRVLRFELLDVDQRWAKPAELLELIGLDGRETTARVVRTAVKRLMPDVAA